MTSANLRNGFTTYYLLFAPCDLLIYCYGDLLIRVVQKDNSFAPAPKTDLVIAPVETAVGSDRTQHMHTVVSSTCLEERRQQWVIS